MKKFSKKPKLALIDYTSKTIYFICLLFAFLPRLYFTLTGRLGFWPADEIGTISSSALLAGYDWSAVVSNAGYYGQGFYCLFAPLYLLTDNPFILYKCIACVCAMMQGCIYFIAYHISTRYFHVENVKFAAIVSLGASYMLNTEAAILYNEHPLLVVTWLVILVLLKLERVIDDKKKRAGFTFLLFFLLVYSLTLHTRALLLAIAFAVVLFGYYFLYKKWLISWPVCFIGGGAACGLGMVFIFFTQKTLWKADSLGGVKNGSISFDNFFAYPLKDAVDGFLRIFLGEINSAYFASFGVAFLCIVIFIPMIFKALFKKGAMDSKLFIITLFCLTGIAGAVVGQSLSWLDHVMIILEEGTNTVYTPGMKALLYFRYMAPFAGPLLLACFLYIKEHSIYTKKFFIGSTIFWAFMQIYFIVAIVPYVEDFQEYKAIRFNPFVGFAFGETVTIYSFIFAIIIVGIAWFIFWFCFKHKKVMLPLVLVTVFLIYHYAAMSAGYVAPLQKKRYRMINAGYRLVEKYEDDIDIPHTIYAPAKNEIITTQNPFFFYQFYLNRYQVLPYAPDATVEDAIVFYQLPDFELLTNGGYVYCQLDNNEYLYVKENQKLHQFFLEEGYEFTK